MPPLPTPVFSPLTESVMLFSTCAPPWFAWLLYSGSPWSRRAGMFALLTAWAALGVANVRYGFDAPVLGEFPARGVVYLAGFTTLAYVFRHRLTSPPLSQRLLVGLQLFRAIGGLFILEWGRGVLPAVFAFPAGLGDLAVAAFAAWILIRYRGEEIPPRVLRTLAYAGIADFTSAFFFGITSSASPIQLFSFDRPNLVDLYPTGLIPNCLVPVALAAHILSLTQLRRAERAAGQSSARQTIGLPERM